MDYASFARTIRMRLLVVTILGAFATVAQAENDVDTEYRVAVGDSLRVQVFGHEDLSGECEVDGAGRCSLPLIKFVDAAGLTPAELEAAVSDRLKPDYLKNPQVRVAVIGYRPVYIMGEVNNPGSYPYSTGMTVINAVALAGGYTYRAARKKITIVRAGQSEEKKERVSEQESVAPGDVIMVPERFF